MEKSEIAESQKGFLKELLELIDKEVFKQDENGYIVVTIKSFSFRYIPKELREISSSLPFPFLLS